MMNTWTWTGTGIGLVMVVCTGLFALGRPRWRDATQTRMALRDAAGVLAPTDSHDAYSAREIEAP